MSEPNDKEQSELLAELSEPDQETVVGGRGSNVFDLSDLLGLFFFDQTEIDTSATNAATYSKGDGQVSTVSNSRYRLRKTTFAFGMPMSRSGGRGSKRKLWRRIFSLLWDDD